jgi:hypothetical protein
MKVFNSNNPDGAAIQRDDEEFLAKCGGQYRVRHPISQRLICSHSKAGR